MNGSVYLHGASMETSRLLSMPWQRDTGVLAGDRLYVSNNVALGLLLAGVCLGGLALLLFLVALFCKRLNTRHFTVFKVSLIVVSLLQMLSTPVVAMPLLGSFCSLEYCFNLFIVWYASRQSGMCLHLLVVLEYLLNTRSPESTKVPLYLSVPVVLTLELISLLFFNVLKARVGLGAVATALFLLTLKACCSPKNASDLKAFCSGLIFFAGTYCPCFALECMILNRNDVSLELYENLLCAANLRLLADIYVCWVTCTDREEEAPQEIEVWPLGPNCNRQARL